MADGTFTAGKSRGLPSTESVEQWTFYWGEWLDAIDEGTKA